MAKILNPQEIETHRRAGSRADRRAQKKQQLDDELTWSENSGGVTIIPPLEAPAQPEETKKLRVAAYCRVSTQEEEQLGSFTAQVRYFREKIEANPLWELVNIYEEEGISGTSIRKRPAFQQMMNDAVEGKIDLILTKDIKRFGRNTVDVLNSLSTLSNLNPPVTVVFESSGITSMGDSSNNLVITILSALAEMESHQKSEAIKWGIRWRMEKGIYRFAVHNTLGYYRDNFGRLVIEPTEAKIIEYIYESCLEGATPGQIANALTDQGISTPMGKERWTTSTVRNILRNEKYCGDALMQKTYTTDFRSHKAVKNTKLVMYFKEGHHTAIIKKSDWQKVQDILATHRASSRRATLRPISTRFVAPRVKSGLCKGYFILDPRWSAMERQEFLKLLK